MQNASDHEVPAAEAVAEGVLRPVTFLGDQGGDSTSDGPSNNAAEAAWNSSSRAHGCTKSSTTVCWMASSSDGEEEDPPQQAGALQDGECDATETGLHAIASCIALLVAAPNAEKGRWLGEMVRYVADSFGGNGGAGVSLVTLGKLLPKLTTAARNVDVT